MSRTRVDLRTSRVIAVVTLLASAALIAAGTAARTVVVEVAHAWAPATFFATTSHAVPASAPACLLGDDTTPHRRTTPRGETPIDRPSAMTTAAHRACGSPRATTRSGIARVVMPSGYDATAPPV